MLLEYFFFYAQVRSLRYGISKSCEKTGSAGLDGLNLGLAPWRPSEAGGQIVTVKVLALGGLNRAQRLARVAANVTSVQRCDGRCAATQRAVLLSLLPV